MERFELILEPTDTQAIFDNLLGVFAQRHGKPLVGLEHALAEAELDRVRKEAEFYPRLPLLRAFPAC